MVFLSWVITDSLAGISKKKKDKNKKIHCYWLLWFINTIMLQWVQSVCNSAFPTILVNRLHEGWRAALEASLGLILKLRSRVIYSAHKVHLHTPLRVWVQYTYSCLQNAHNREKQINIYNRKMSIVQKTLNQLFKDIRVLKFFPELLTLG
jgi:hypothetical protein